MSLKQPKLPTFFSQEEREAWHNLQANKPASSDLQKLAQKENFALFTLAGMQSNLVHLRGVVPTSYISLLIQSIEAAQANIKAVQATRRTQRAIERHYKK